VKSKQGISRMRVRESEKEREKGSLVLEVEYCAKGVAASVLNSPAVEFLNNLSTCAKLTIKRWHFR